MKQGTLRVSFGQVKAPYQKLLAKASRTGVIHQIMARDPKPFSNSKKIQKLVGNRLGWVDSASLMKRRVGQIEKFGNEVLKDGIKHVVLMGMGGSSLCPELFGLMFKRHPKLKSFNVIDSTDPAAVRAVARKIEPKKSLFIVASKSGGTVETRSQEAFFLNLLKEAGVKKVGRHFAAITDKGSALQAFAHKKRYRKTFVNPSDIGGRYSALSFFGLVPAFFAGVDLRLLLDEAVATEKLLDEREGETNPAVVIGSLLAAASKQGRDKMTFLASKKTAPLVPWIEQLVAESTGKRGKGVVPIDAEPHGRMDQYGKDRLFLQVKMEGERTADHDRFVARAEAMGVPVITVTMGHAHELGRQFLLWEAITAVTGYHLRINPFDEPNVTESKENTKKILSAFERSGEFPDQLPHSKWGKLSLVAYDGAKRYTYKQITHLPSLLKKFMAGGKPPKYFTVLNYFKADTASEKALADIRTLVRRKTKMATLRGFGPRYLHSIGQLYKGGPANGVFVVFVRAKYGRLEIPGQAYDFGQLISAQAMGDAQALIKRKLPTLVIAIDGKPADGLVAFKRALNSALK
ncbi:hypothetical protein GF377_09285 [candidate division GN15 bacterium]|nr:hypothetical protein [candidate division GN15 bacterium]